MSANQQIGLPRGTSADLAARASGNPTKREVSVLLLLVQGQTNKEIGRELALHELSVRDVVCRLLRKFSFVSRAQFLNSELPPEWLAQESASAQTGSTK